MKIIHTLTGQCTDSSAPAAAVQPTDIHTTQTSKGGFERRTRKIKNGLIFEWRPNKSSPWQQAFSAENDLWNMVEAHCPDCCLPKVTAAPASSGGASKA